MTQDQIRNNIEMMGYRVPYGPIDCRPGRIIPLMSVDTSILGGVVATVARFLGF